MSHLDRHFWLSQSKHLCQGYSSRDSVPCSPHPSGRGHVMFSWATTAFARLDEKGGARQTFPLQRLSFSSEQNHLQGDSSKLCDSSPSQITSHPLVFINSKHWWFLLKSIITLSLAKWWFSNPPISTFTRWHYPAKKNFPCPLLFISFLVFKCLPQMNVFLKSQCFIINYSHYSLGWSNCPKVGMRQPF